MSLSKKKLLFPSWFGVVN